METKTQKQRLLDRIEKSFAAFYYKYSDEQDPDMEIDLYQIVLTTMLSTNKIIHDAICYRPRINKNTLSKLIEKLIQNFAKDFQDTNNEVNQLKLKTISDTYNHLSRTIDIFFEEEK